MKDRIICIYDWLGKSELREQNDQRSNNRMIHFTPGQQVARCKACCGAGIRWIGAMTPWRSALSSLCAMFLIAIIGGSIYANAQDTLFEDRVESLIPKNEEVSVPYRMLIPNGEQSSGRKSLLIFLYGRGGSHREYNLSRPPYELLRKNLADRGYYVLVPELGPSHWMNHRARRVLDQIIERVLEDYPIDSSRVHIMGTSMGGGSALGYAVHRPNLIRSVVVRAPMTDFAQWHKENIRYRKELEAAFGGTPQEVPKPYAESSAMANLDALVNIPIFMIHGDLDVLVLPHHSKQLEEALRARGGHVLYRQAIGIGHNDKAIIGFENEVVDFFDAAVIVHRPLADEKCRK